VSSCHVRADVTSESVGQVAEWSHATADPVPVMTIFAAQGRAQGRTEEWMAEAALLCKRHGRYASEWQTMPQVLLPDVRRVWALTAGACSAVELSRQDLAGVCWVRKGEERAEIRWTRGGAH
jgi:hypothetical protein